MPAPKLVDGFMDPESLFERMRRLAAIDEVVAPEFPSFEFDPRWARGEKMAAFKDGGGDAVFVWSNAKGTVVRGYDVDTGVSPSLDGFPKALSSAIREPAFGADEELTFVRWRLAHDKHWRGTRAPQRVVDDLLGFAGPNAAQWLEHYYGEKIGAAVLAILNAETLDADAVRALAPSKKKPTRKKPTKAKKKRKKRPRQVPSFGQAAFEVQCEPTYVQMVIHGTEVVVRAKEDVYLEIFDWVKARLKRAARATRP